MAECFFKVFGERNTGTNAVSQMLEQHSGLSVLNGDGTGNHADEINYFVAQTRFYRSPFRREYRSAIDEHKLEGLPPLRSWKHCAPQFCDAFDRENLVVVFMVRDPYSWIVSLWNRPYHIFGPDLRSLQRFIERPWKTLRVEGAPTLLRSPLELWNRKLRAYESFIEASQERGRTSFVIKFEDFIQDSTSVVEQLLRAAPVKAESVREIDTSVKSRSTSLAKLRAFYAREGWRRYVSQGAWDAIEERVDWSLAERFGYGRKDFDPSARNAFDALRPWLQKRGSLW